MDDSTRNSAESGYIAGGKNEWIFWILGVVLAVTALTFSFYGIRFLVQQLNSAFNPSLIKPAETVKFNLDKIKELGL